MFNYILISSRQKLAKDLEIRKLMFIFALFCQQSRIEDKPRETDRRNHKFCGAKNKIMQS